MLSGAFLLLYWDGYILPIVPVKPQAFQYICHARLISAGVSACRHRANAAKYAHCGILLPHEAQVYGHLIHNRDRASHIVEGDSRPSLLPADVTNQDAWISCRLFFFLSRQD